MGSTKKEGFSKFKHIESLILMHIIIRKGTCQSWVCKSYSNVCFKVLLLRLNLADSVDQQVASGVIPAESFLGPITHASLISQIVWLSDAPVGVASGLTSGIPDPVTVTALINQG